jgi:nucleotide-binding universal stress UspA family protein
MDDERQSAVTAPAAAGSVVVGHDGSHGADQALAEACGLARALGAPVVVVRAWSLATAPRPPDWEFGYVPAFEEYAETVRLALVDDARAQVEAFPELSVDYRVVRAGAAKSLVEISKEARLLVVGARGLGGLTGMLLGSVSEQCVRHATCSVLVAKAHG